MFLSFTLHDGRAITISALHITTVFPKLDAPTITRINTTDGREFDLKDAYHVVNERLIQGTGHG